MLPKQQNQHQGQQQPKKQLGCDLIVISLVMTNFNLKVVWDFYTLFQVFPSEEYNSDLQANSQQKFSLNPDYSLIASKHKTYRLD